MTVFPVFSAVEVEKTAGWPDGKIRRVRDDVLGIWVTLKDRPHSSFTATSRTWTIVAAAPLTHFITLFVVFS